MDVLEGYKLIHLTPCTTHRDTNLRRKDDASFGTEVCASKGLLKDILDVSRKLFH
jgi:hypothetical protein